MSGRVGVELATGRIDMDVTRADWPLDALCDFAARDNPRRAFLVVSKVLGRHIPVAPFIMRRTFRDLAARVPADLPGPVLVVGMAETAICLGQGVHEELLKLGHAHALYLHSTRQKLDHPLLATFEEPHSHAARHLLYRPADPRFTEARSLVLVDDEVSSGTTLANAAAAVVEAVPTIERIVALSLTDWSNGDVAGRLPCAAVSESLLSGALRWTAGDRPPADERPSFATAARSLGAMDAHHNFGRLGRAGVANEGDRIAGTLALPPGSRLRVLGTCEFTYPPFRLAEVLEAAGHDVVVQSTTRSPALIGGAMASRIAFADNYGTGVANYLYNADPRDGRRTLVCHETPPGSIDGALIEALDARPVYFGDLT